MNPRTRAFKNLYVSPRVAAKLEALERTSPEMADYLWSLLRDLRSGGVPLEQLTYNLWAAKPNAWIITVTIDPAREDDGIVTGLTR